MTTPDPRGRLRRIEEEEAVLVADPYSCEHVRKGYEVVAPAMCPYQYELHGDERLCLCCDGCRHQCACDV